MTGWKITAPVLTDQERAQAIQPGGLTSGTTELSAAARAVFAALQSKAHIYAGTVPPAVVDERRRRNRVARRSRRINRLAAAR